MLDLSLDALTGLPNLIGMVDELRELPAGHGAFVGMDIEGLGAVNQEHGMAVGDRVIKALADSLASVCTSQAGTARAFRCGGDEFVLLLEDIDRPAAQQMAEACRRRFAEGLHAEGLPGVDLRYSVAAYPEDGTTLAQLCSKFHLELYHTGNAPAAVAGAPSSWVESLLGWFIERLAETVHELRLARHLALTDGISGLANHRAGEAVLDRMVAQFARDREPFSVLFVDGDNLKGYNDTLGYEGGNQMIRQLSALLSSSIRAGDSVCRWLSGDEFLVILPGADREVALSIAERLRREVAAASQGWPLPVTVSIGVAACPEDGEDAANLLGLATMANSQAKQGGKNRVV
ncbi:MAG: GGDEF domain-containing protein [Bacillota bacterium]|nr:GGDEF domain-containing protein [Bacillota bacterium]